MANLQPISYPMSAYPISTLMTYGFVLKAHNSFFFTVVDRNYHFASCVKTLYTSKPQKYV